MTWDDLKKELSQQYLEQGREEGVELGREEGIEIGEARGREEGRAEGREEGKEEVVSNLLKTGIESEKISNLTEIPLEKVLEIKAKCSI